MGAGVMGGVVEKDAFERGDIVYYVRQPEKRLIVCGAPLPYNGSLVVECKPEGKRENGFTHNLYDVKALVRVTE